MNFQENNKAIYLQIADKICDDILLGHYADDSRIPSVREYAATVEVNANTVMRSYDYLQSHEIIYNKRGIGYFIAPGARQRITRSRLDSFKNTEMEQFFKQLQLLGITPQQLSDLYSEYCQTTKQK